MATPDAGDGRLVLPRAIHLIVGAWLGVAVMDLLSGGGLRGPSMLIPGFLWEGGLPLPFSLLAPLAVTSDELQLLLLVGFLLVIGPLTEARFGRARTLATFTIAGVFGLAASAALAPQVATAGAAVGTCGVAGLLLGWVVLRQGALERPFERPLERWQGAALVVGLGLILTYDVVHPLASTVADVGGLATGVLLSVVFEPILQSPPRPVAGAVASAGIVAGLVTSLLYARTTVEGTLPHAIVISADHYLTGDLARAVGELEEAFATDSGGSAATVVRPFALNQLAWMYVELGRDYPQALQLSQEATRLQPNIPEFLDTLGYLYALTDRCDRAVDAMSQAVAIHGGYARRRSEVERACEEGDRPDPDVPIDDEPEIKPTPSDDAIRA